MGYAFGMRILLRLLAIALWVMPAVGQVSHSFGPLDVPNVWTATQQFSPGALFGPVPFASLPSSPVPINGTLIYCTDCVAQNPCAASGTGAFAERVNGAWACTITGGGITGTLTTTFIPVATSASAVTNSGLSETGGTLSMTDLVVQSSSSSSGFFDFTRSVAGKPIRLRAPAGSSGAGGSATVSGGDASAGAGGTVNINAGSGGSTFAGGSVLISAGPSADPSTGAAGSVRLDGSTGTSGANILLGPGFGGSGTSCTGCIPGAVIFDLCQTSTCNTDNYGSLSLSAATTTSYTFTQTYGAHPNCTLTPGFDPGSSVRFWITYTAATAFTVNFSSAVTGAVSYHCWGHV